MIRINISRDPDCVTIFHNEINAGNYCGNPLHYIEKLIKLSYEFGVKDGPAPLPNPQPKPVPPPKPVPAPTPTPTPEPQPKPIPVIQPAPTGV